jgi:xylulose-5-phosphate/fructose-6-phosphate phosphoketolase
VLPILHLNGYKIANPTVLARIPEDELDALMRGYGYEPLFVRSARRARRRRTRRFAAALDEALDESRAPASARATAARPSGRGGR